MYSGREQSGESPFGDPNWSPCCAYHADAVQQDNGHTRQDGHDQRTIEEPAGPRIGLEDDRVEPQPPAAKRFA